MSADVPEIFRRHLAAHGGGAKAVGWGSDASQRRRFEVLAGIGDLTGTSVLDFGSGLGHFLDWLGERGVAPHYLGIDITPQLVARARETHPGAAFEVGSYDELNAILGARDFGPTFVVASGVFYLDLAGGHEGLMANVARLFAVAGKGLAFNCLSARRANRDDGEFYAEPGRVLDDCLKLTSRVMLRHDYHPGDFTCLLWKDSA